MATSAFCPATRCARSYSVTLATQLESRFVEHLGHRPAGIDGVAGAILGNNHPVQAAPTLSLSFTATSPSNGARMRMLSMFRCAVSIISRALFRFSSATAIEARLVASRDGRSVSSWASRRFASSSVSRFFLASTALSSSLACAWRQLGAPHIEPRRQQRHLVLRLLHHDIGAQLGNLLLRLLELRARLREPFGLLAQIELDHHISRLDGGAGAHDVKDLKRTANRRRHQSSRADRPQLAGGMDHHRHIALHHMRGRNHGAAGLHALGRNEPPGRR